MIYWCHLIFLGQEMSFSECINFAVGQCQVHLMSSSTELLVHAVLILATYFTIMFLAHAASLDRYNLQTYNGCIYCAYFGRYGKNLKILQHLLVTYTKRKLKIYHMGFCWSIPQKFQGHTLWLAQVRKISKLFSFWA